MIKHSTTKPQAQRNMRRGRVCYPSCFCLACTSFMLAMPHAETEGWEIHLRCRQYSPHMQMSGHFSIFLEIWTWLASCQTEKSVRDHTQDLSLLLSHFSTFASCLTWFINYYSWIVIFFLSPDNYSDCFGLSAPLGETTSQNLLLE